MLRCIMDDASVEPVAAGAPAVDAPTRAPGEGGGGDGATQARVHEQQEERRMTLGGAPEQGRGQADPAGCTLVEGGNVRVALPSAMLDTCASLSDVLNVDTWRNVLDDEERDALRAMLPDPKASDEDVEALIAKLFAEASSAPSTASASAQEGGSSASERYFHFGNPATRVWREIRNHERHPEVMRHKTALAMAERGILEYEVRLQHSRVLRNGLSMKRVFDGTHADVTPSERAIMWKKREPSPEPGGNNPPPDPLPSTPPPRTGGGGGGGGGGAANGAGGAAGHHTPGGLRAAQAALAAAEKAAQVAVKAAVDAAAAAQALAVATGTGGAGALKAVEAAEAALDAAEVRTPNTISILSYTL